MSEACAISSCKRFSCALCHCCQKNLCLPHLKEHQDLLVSGLDPLVDQINALGDRLKAVNIERKIAGARQELEDWRAECHRKIDSLFEQKCRELDRKVTEKIDKNRKEISQIQSKIAELVREQQTNRRDLDLLTSTMNALQREMDKIEQSSFSIRCHPLVINHDMVVIGELNAHRLDCLNLQSIYKVIKCSDKMSLIAAANDHFLLIQQGPNLCLVDQTLTIVKQGLLSNALIHDMCWSSVLDRFIIIQEDNLFLVNPSTLSIEEMSTIKKKNWYSCTCSDRSLYISTSSGGSSMDEYSLLPTISLIRRHKSPDTCQKDELIDHMRYNNERLALVITAIRTGTVHVELRTANTFQRLWSLQLDIINIQKWAYRCCLINEDEWFVADYGSSRFIHITGNGELKVMHAYSSVPRYACMFGSDILAVVANTGINFHKF